MVRDEIKKIIEKATKEFKVSEVLIERSKHADYSTNVAMIIAKQSKKNPKEVAELLIKKIDNKIFKKIEIAGPGFINFFLSKDYLRSYKVVDKLDIGKEKINVEFISANPTGPLTLGNGRGGFGGDILANVLEKVGNKVTREFYINDKGKQIEDLKKGLYPRETRTASQIQKENQKTIIKNMKIKIDVWFSEKSLSKEIDKVLSFLKKKDLSYENEGAIWFKSTLFGDDKDRVLIKKNGEMTYFTSDIAYLKNKFDRGFKKAIILLGADHYGYLGRMKGVAEALGYDKNQLDFIFFQMVHLFDGKKEIKMSKRAGTYITIDEVIDEVGLDVVRFFFLQRSANSHLNFDLKIAKEKSQKNPVYYIQYAYARISSILKKAKIKSSKDFSLLEKEEELDLIKQLIRFEEILEDTAKDYQIQRIPQYALELAESFHRFYQCCQVISNDNPALTGSRLALVSATKTVLKNTLDLMGISAPEKM